MLVFQISYGIQKTDASASVFLSHTVIFIKFNSVFEVGGVLTR